MKKLLILGLFFVLVIGLSGCATLLSGGMPSKEDPDDLKMYKSLAMISDITFLGAAGLASTTDYNLENPLLMTSQIVGIASMAGGAYAFIKAGEINHEKFKKEREIELRIAKDRFSSNPNLCPINIMYQSVHKDDFGSTIFFNAENISPWDIEVFKVRIWGLDSLGGYINLGVYKNYVEKIYDIKIDSLYSKHAEYSTIFQGINSVIVEVIQVKYSDGTQWVR